MPLYTAYNGPMVTTGSFAPVSTGTAIKTMLQVATPSTRKIKVVAWGVSGSAFAAVAPLKIELIETDVAATVTAHTSTGVQPYNDAGAPASAVTLSTTATGYTASAEGTITATRYADLHQIPPSGLIDMMWSLGQEFEVAISKFLRVRVIAPADVSLTTWVRWSE